MRTITPRHIIVVLFLIMGISSLSAQINIRTHYMRGRQQLASHEFRGVPKAGDEFVVVPDDKLVVG